MIDANEENILAVQLLADLSDLVVNSNIPLIEVSLIPTRHLGMSRALEMGQARKALRVCW